MKVGSSEQNLLLRTLPAEIGQQLTAEEYEIRKVLIGAEETPRYVYFPHGGGVVSIVRTTSSGQMVEAGIVGSEGMLNVHSILTAPAPTASQAVVQNGGSFTRMEVSKVRELFEAHHPFRDALLAYTSVFLDQVTQNLLCNRLHPIELRLAKWLLMMRDRVGSDQLTLTQEFLSYMLGVHRPAVSIAVSTLEADALVRHRRNLLQIVSAEGVAERSCECYPPLKARLKAFSETLN